MEGAYQFFEEKYKNSQQMYQAIKKEKDLFTSTDEGLTNIHKSISLTLTEDQFAVRMILDKYDLYKEENSGFLSQIEKNDMYNIIHFTLGEYETNRDFLPSVLQHESDYLNIKPLVIAANLLQDRERLFFMKIINQYDLPPEKFAEEMHHFDNNNIISAFQYLSDWFDSIGVVSPKEKFIVILLALSKLLYLYEVNSKSIADMGYKNDLSERLLEKYNNPEMLDRSSLSEDQHIEVLKVIHTLSFFAAQLTY